MKVRFTVRTLLVLTTALALGTAFVFSRMHRAKEQNDVVKLVTENGLVFYDDQESQAIEIDLLALNFPTVNRKAIFDKLPSGRRAPGFLVDFFGRDFFHSVHVVDVVELHFFAPEVQERHRETNRRLMEELISELPKLTSLHTVRLNCSPGTRLEPLERVPNLRRIVFNYEVNERDLKFLEKTSVSCVGFNISVSDGVIRQICKSSGLRELQMSCLGLQSTITNAGVIEISELSELIDLRLNSPLITDDGCDHLKRLKSLQKLTLRLPATERPVHRIVEQLPLKELRLLDMVVSEEFFEAVGRMPYLETLCLDWTRGDAPLSDAAVAELCRCRALQFLLIEDTWISREQISLLENQRGINVILRSRPGQ